MNKASVTAGAWSGRFILLERGCPNVADAHAQRRLTPEQTGLPAHWRKWKHGEPASEAPSYRIDPDTQGRWR